MNVSEATRQLLCHLAFNFCNLGLFGIELKPGVGTSQWSRAELSWLQLRTQLSSSRFETSGNESLSIQQPTALIIHTCTGWPSCIVYLGRICDPGWSFILWASAAGKDVPPMRTLTQWWTTLTDRAYYT